MLSFGDLAESPEFGEFCAITHELTGMLVVLVDPQDGHRRKAMFSPEQVNPVCRIIRSCPAGAVACEESLRSSCEQATNHQEGSINRCHADLVSTAVPVYDGERYVATLLAGQVFTQQPSEIVLDRLRRRCEGLFLPSSDLRAAYYRSPHLSQDKVLETLRLLSFFGSFLCEASDRLDATELRKQHSAIEAAKRYIDERFRGPVRLDEVAAHISLSPAYFSTLFKKLTGEAFCHYVQRQRIEEAKRLLHGSTETVTAISQKVGFNSLTHFTRVFHRFEGCAPGQFRR